VAALASRHSLGSLLEVALRLWLRSQLERADGLQLAIDSRNAQLLRGRIESVRLACRHASYAGLHLEAIELTGRGIQANVGQLWQGQAFRLLAPVPVSGQLCLSERGLQASLASPLLHAALRDLLARTAGAELVEPGSELHWHDARLQLNGLALWGSLVPPAGTAVPLMLQGGLQLAAPNRLQLQPLQITCAGRTVAAASESAQIALGPDLQLDELRLQAGALWLRGQFTVRP